MPSVWGESAPYSPLGAPQIRARLEGQTQSVSLVSGVATVVDSISVDSYPAGTWEVHLVKGTSRRRAVVRFLALGASPSADATGVDYSEDGVAETGTVDVALSVDVTGTGTSQVARLLATASSSGWTANSVRSFLKATN